MKRLAAWATGLPPRVQDFALAMALAVYNVASLIPEARQLQLPYLAFVLVVLSAAALAQSVRCTDTPRPRALLR